MVEELFRDLGVSTEQIVIFRQSNFANVTYGGMLKVVDELKTIQTYCKNMLKFCEETKDTEGIKDWKGSMELHADAIYKILISKELSCLKEKGIEEYREANPGIIFEEDIGCAGEYTDISEINNS